MIALRKLIFPALGVLAVAIVACGGGGSAGSPAIPKGAPTSAAHAQVAVKIVVGAASANAPARIKRRMAEAASTNGLQIVVYPDPQGTSAPILTQAFDTSAVSALCTANSDGSRSCLGTLALAPATYTMVITSYDASPVSGVIPGSAHALGYQMLIPTIAAGTGNVIPLSLDGIATGVSVTLPVPIVHTTDALTQQAAIVALDAANDAIVATNYVDVNGNPVSINIASNNGALVSVGPASISSASSNGIGVSYTPAGLTAAEMSGGASVSITATVVGGGSSSATLTVPSGLQSVSINAPAVGISVQAPSSLWVAEPAGYLQCITLAAPITAQSPDPVATVSGLVGMSPAPSDVVYNAGDNYLYFTMSNNNVLGRLPTSGAQFQEGGVSLSAPGTSVATDGTNIWTIEPSLNKLGWVQASIFSFSNEFLAAPSSGLSQIVAGTSGDMWYTESASNEVGAASSPSPGPIAEVGLTTIGSVPSGIAWDGSSTMWVAESNASKIASVVGAPGAAVVTEYSLGAGGQHPLNIVVGPDFGNVWFDYSSPAAGIGRITPAGVVTLYPLPVGAIPGRMATAGGLIWVTDSANATIYGVSP